MTYIADLINEPTQLGISPMKLGKIPHKPTDKEMEYDKGLLDIHQMIDVSKQEGNWNYDLYSHGLLVGLDLARSCFEDVEHEWDCSITNPPVHGYLVDQRNQEMKPQTLKEALKETIVKWTQEHSNCDQTGALIQLYNIGNGQWVVGNEHGYDVASPLTPYGASKAIYDNPDGVINQCTITDGGAGYSSGPCVNEKSNIEKCIEWGVTQMKPLNITATPGIETKLIPAQKSLVEAACDYLAEQIKGDYQQNRDNFKS